MKPLVSVCIPAFNAAHLLPASIGAATRQTYANLDILVYDNASGDNTTEVVRALAAGDPRIRYLRHAENVGMIRNFNACIAQAKGDYVKFLCADDTLEADCVAQMVEVILAHPEVALVACARQYIDENARPTGVTRSSRRFLLADGAATIRRCFFFGNLIGEPTAVMFRRADAGRGFDESYRQILDMDMWFHLLKHGAFAALPATLCTIRWHVKQATFENLKTGVVLGDKRRLFREFHADIGGRASFIEQVMWDARMASTVRRSVNAGYSIDLGDIEELFFRRYFRSLTYPLASALWKLSQREF
jgi:glycosyltransferase involved in cell wall biosynthesis